MNDNKIIEAKTAKYPPPGDGHRLEPVKDRELPYREAVLLCLDNRINDD
ncbi:MAG: hypothetical protein L6422_12200 [Candidatus Marinimicrobia bacterium]|nr:hypothetical protein [bacterium]MCG2717007.1 hypothetical protein [Candidatus Neomarinimicrobiota bacterium]